MKKSKEMPVMFNEADRLVAFSKIVLWLYKNDKGFNSAIEWKSALIDFIAEVLKIDNNI